MKRCAENYNRFCPDYPEKCHLCGAFREPTNADRIRAQPDEDLAKELAMIADWDRKELAKAKRGPGLVKFMENWLQAPAGEDTYHA